MDVLLYNKYHTNPISIESCGSDGKRIRRGSEVAFCEKGRVVPGEYTKSSPRSLTSNDTEGLTCSTAKPVKSKASSAQGLVRLKMV